MSFVKYGDSSDGKITHIVKSSDDFNGESVKKKAERVLSEDEEQESKLKSAEHNVN